ncbi:MAG: PspC domain-containing protein [Saprospiraceae bacterium]|nr:PspC domain-containing protein [Candidatus Brachybacter algidus]
MKKSKSDRMISGVCGGLANYEFRYCLY